MWIQLAVLIVATVISYLLRPEVKTEIPEVEDMENPTADAGRPIPVVFGTMQVTGLNVLWFGDKEYKEREVETGKK
jgi:hypothetical protein